MKTTWMLTLFIALTGFVASAYENPLKKANVGEWIEHKRTTTLSAGGKTMEQTVKQTVKAKDEKEITLFMEMTMMGRSLPGMDVKVPLDVPYNPAAAGGKDTKAKMEVVGEGDEEIKVGDKTYACHWIEMKGTTEIRGEPADTHSKYWTCKDVPLNGIVKLEFDSSKGMKMTMELTGAGTNAAK